MRRCLRTLIRFAVGASVAVVASLTAIPTAPATAATTSPTLDGEVFQASSLTITPSPSCGFNGAGSPHFTVSGTATGPLPGTFTETGQWDFDLLLIQTVDTTFTIHSGGKTYSGVMLYDNTSTGPDGKSIVNNLGTCFGAAMGGAYSTCASQALSGACAGQSVIYLGTDAQPSGGFSQRFYHLTPPYHLVVTGGDNQSAPAGGVSLPAPLQVQVLDANNAPAWGRPVTFRGRPAKYTYILFSSVYSDMDGLASVTDQTTAAVGSYTVVATGPGGATATFSLTTTP